LHRGREGDDDMGKGPLVRVEIEPGRYGMMHRQETIEAGLIAAPKRRKPAEDKVSRPEGDKGKRESGNRDSGSGKAGKRKSADDFVIIRGIGPATVEALHEAGDRHI
jgi:predicted flap endonuclease-1-like 5' DNA nuclease